MKLSVNRVQPALRPGAQHCSADAWRRHTCKRTNTNVLAYQCVRAHARRHAREHYLNNVVAHAHAHARASVRATLAPVCARHSRA
eukprot:2307870-Pleurochrysis_carterae.AAC.2